MIIAAFCASLQSAVNQKLSSVKLRKNKKVIKICDLLSDLGYIAGYTCLDNKFVLINLKYTAGRGPLRSLALFSRGSSRTYLGRRNLMGRRVNNYYKTNSFTILSTATGLFMTDIECFMHRIGGEPLCIVT